MYAVLAGEIIDQALKSTVDDTLPVSKHTNHTSNLAILSNNYVLLLSDFLCMHTSEENGIANEAI